MRKGLLGLVLLLMASAAQAGLFYVPAPRYIDVEPTGGANCAAYQQNTAYIARDTGKTCVCNTTWSCENYGAGAGGAPTTATYITQTPDGGLSAEQALSALATGLVKNTTTTGVLSIAVAGTDYLAPDVELTSIAGLTSTADRVPYYTGSGTAALATFTGAGRALVDDADATAQRVTMGVVIGTNVQGYDADLAAIAALACADGEPIEKAAGVWACGTDDGGAGSGDVTAVGNCAGGDCFDGTSDGGYELTFYNAAGNAVLSWDGNTLNSTKPISVSDPGDGNRYTSFLDNSALGGAGEPAAPAAGSTVQFTVDGEFYKKDSGDGLADILMLNSGNVSGAVTVNSVGVARVALAHTECFTLYDVDGLAVVNLMSVWKAPDDVTVTAISCEASNATDITINLNKDDLCNTAAMSTNNIESGDLQCGTSDTAGTVDTNNDNLADGDCVDLEVVAVTASTRVTVCMEYTYD